MNHRFSATLFVALTILLAFPAVGHASQLYDYRLTHLEELDAVQITEARPNGSFQFVVRAAGAGCGLITDKGELAVPFQYAQISNTNGQISLAASFQGGGTGGPPSYSYTHINKDGSVFRQWDSSQYVSVSSFSDGYCLAETYSGQHELHDINGNVLLTSTEELALPSEALVLFQDNGRYGYLNVDGDVIIPAGYVKASSFSDGLAAVEADSWKGYIDRTGNAVLTLDYESLRDFSGGVAVVEKHGSYGLIDKTGREVLPCQFSFIADSSDGKLRLHMGEKAAFYTNSGEAITEFIYNPMYELSDFHDGAAVLRDEKIGLFGAIDQHGETIVPFTFQLLSDFQLGTAIGVQDDKTYLVSLRPKAAIVIVNGKNLTTDQPPYTEHGRVLVPLRNIMEALGAVVGWNPVTQTVTISKDRDTVTFQIGNQTADRNGKQITMDVPAVIKDGHTMVPLRFLSESFNYQVLWHEEINAVEIL